MRTFINTLIVILIIDPYVYALMTSFFCDFQLRLIINFSKLRYY